MVQPRCCLKLCWKHNHWEHWVIWSHVCQSFASTFIHYAFLSVDAVRPFDLQRDWVSLDISEVSNWLCKNWILILTFFKMLSAIYQTTGSSQARALHSKDFTICRIEETGPPVTCSARSRNDTGRTYLILLCQQQSHAKGAKHVLLPQSLLISPQRSKQSEFKWPAQLNPGFRKTKNGWIACSSFGICR